MLLCEISMVPSQQAFPDVSDKEQSLTVWREWDFSGTGALGVAGDGFG